MQGFHNRRSFWITLALINLSIVAFLGFLLRSKILFPLPFLDFAGLLSAHSHFAFAGWAGLSLVTLLTFDILPPESYRKKIYRGILITIQVSGLGMAVTFPFYGYNAFTIVLSSLYVLAAVVFVPVFISDLAYSRQDRTVKLLSIAAVLSLMVSFLGTLGLTYRIASGGGGGRHLYRDSIYTFLHFQYNGFFTLSVFALFANYLLKRGFVLDKNARRFSLFLCLSVVPALFLALLWHNNPLFYTLSALACVLILITLFYCYLFLKAFPAGQPFSPGITRTFWMFSILSFTIKMVLQIGTIIPALGNAVYGDRPVIIGFLHLVFLGFITFFILAVLIEDGFFTVNKRVIRFPFLIFTTAIIGNELFLMLQGVGILLKTNNDIYKWILWIVAILLFTGAVSMAVTRLYVISKQKGITAQ